jgi:hypothetical protein
MSSVFRTKNLQDTGIDNVFILEKSCRKMYTIFSAVQRQQRNSDVMTSFGRTAYYQVPHFPHCRVLPQGVAHQPRVRSTRGKTWRQKPLDAA